MAEVNSPGGIAIWTTAAKDNQDQQAIFDSFALDHSSGTRAEMHHFCLGSHPGDSNP